MLFHTSKWWREEGETAPCAMSELLGCFIMKITKKPKDALAIRRDLSYFFTLLRDVWCLFSFIPQLPYSLFLKSRTKPMTACSKRWVLPWCMLPWSIVCFLQICSSEYIFLLDSEAFSKVRLKGLYRSVLQYCKCGVGLCPLVQLCKMQDTIANSIEEVYSPLGLQLLYYFLFWAMRGLLIIIQALEH